MKRKQYTLVWVASIIAAVLLLTACVRPVPTEPVATLTPGAPETVQEIPTSVPVITPEPIIPTEPTEPTDPDVTEEAAEITDPEVTQPPAENQIYVVKPGDSLGKIANQFGITVEELTQANDITATTVIHPGDELIIPGETAVVEAVTPVPTTPPVEGTGGQNNNQQGQQNNSGVHVVQQGENLFRIGLKYGCTVNQMAQFNGIGNPNYIYPGQPLKIPPSC